MRFLCVLLFLATPLWAVQPDEVLDDPALEERARAISAELRCPVCQNESIDESNATLARDLRILLRERLVAGDTDDEVKDYLVTRYGEFVLLTPTLTGANWVLWLAAPAMFLLALGIGWAAIRRRPAAVDDQLSVEEKDALEKILRS